MATFSRFNTNIYLTYENACFILNAGVSGSDHVKDIVLYNRRKVNDYETIVWDVENNKLWLVDKGDGIKYLPPDITLELLLLIPTVEARLAYINQ